MDQRVLLDIDGPQVSRRPTDHVIQKVRLI